MGEIKEDIERISERIDFIRELMVTYENDEEMSLSFLEELQTLNQEVVLLHEKNKV